MPAYASTAMLLILVLAMLLLPAAAAAYPFLCDVEPYLDQQPMHGRTGVPLNARVVTHLRYCGMPVSARISKDGIPVPATTSEWREETSTFGTVYGIATPDAPLQPGRRYELVFETQLEGDVITWFETGDNVLESATLIGAPSVEILGRTCESVGGDGLLQCTSTARFSAPQGRELDHGHFILRQAGSTSMRRVHANLRNDNRAEFVELRRADDRWCYRLTYVDEAGHTSEESADVCPDADEQPSPGAPAPAPVGCPASGGAAWGLMLLVRRRR